MRGDLLGSVRLYGGDETADMAALVRSLELEPPIELDVDCPPLPPDVERVLFGEAVVAARQLGDAEGLDRPGTTAAVICGWIE